MKHLIWITLFLGASVHAANQKFDCGMDPLDTPAEAFRQVLTLKAGNHLFETDYLQDKGPETFELYGDDRTDEHGDWVFGRQVETVKLKKDSHGIAYDVRLIVDGEKARICEPN